MGDALQARVHIAAVSEVEKTRGAEITNWLGWRRDFFGRYNFNCFCSEIHFFETYDASVFGFGLFGRDAVFQEGIPAPLLLFLKLKLELFRRDLESALGVADAVEELRFPLEVSLNAACVVAVSPQKCFIAEIEK